MTAQRMTITGDSEKVLTLWDAIRQQHPDVITDDSSFTERGEEGVLELLTTDPDTIAGMRLVRLTDVQVVVADA